MAATGGAPPSARRCRRADRLGGAVRRCPRRRGDPDPGPGLPEDAALAAGLGRVLRGIRQLDPRPAAAGHPEHLPGERGGPRHHPDPDRAGPVRRLLLRPAIGPGRSSPDVAVVGRRLHRVHRADRGQLGHLVVRVLPVREPGLPRRRVRRRHHDDRRGVPRRSPGPGARHAAHVRRPRHHRRRHPPRCRAPGRARSSGAPSTSSGSLPLLVLGFYRRRIKETARFEAVQRGTGPRRRQRRACSSRGERSTAAVSCSSA